MISFQIVHRFKWVEKKYVDSVFILTDSTGTQTKIKVQIKFKSTRRLLFWAQDSAVFLLSQHTMQWIQCFVVVFFCFLFSFFVKMVFPNTKLWSHFCFVYMSSPLATMYRTRSCVQNMQHFFPIGRILLWLNNDCLYRLHIMKLEYQQYDV